MWFNVNEVVYTQDKLSKSLPSVVVRSRSRNLGARGDSIPNRSVGWVATYSFDWWIFIWTNNICAGSGAEMSWTCPFQNQLCIWLSSPAYSVLLVAIGFMSEMWDINIVIRSISSWSCTVHTFLVANYKVLKIHLKCAAVESVQFPLLVICLAITVANIRIS